MKKTFLFALKQSLPIACGYLFLGTAFGILMTDAGYGVLWSFAVSLFVYAGSLQFVLVSMLVAGMPLLTVAVTAFFINARHLFYGFSFLTRFRTMGWRYPYMVLSLTDETYSVLCSCRCPAGVSEADAMFLIALLHHFYWVAGSVVGALLGSLIPFDCTGIDFSMTALFVVLLIEQLKTNKQKLPVLLGALLAVGFLLLLGPSRFLLPTLCLLSVILIVFRKQFQKEGGTSV